MQPFVLLEDRLGNPDERLSLYFTDPVGESLCYDAQQLILGLEQVEMQRKHGYYIVSCISYEASYLFNMPLSMHYVHHHTFPLAHFLYFKNCQYLTQDEVTLLLNKLVMPPVINIYNLKLNITYAQYCANFAKIKQHLAEGDTYQVNYTSKFKFKLHGDPIALYIKLRAQQLVAYSALWCTNNYQLLSLSPELFFAKQADTLTVKPMKGTMPRSDDAVIDAQNQYALQHDPKLIAENIIIVDLLRNDLSAISVPGSVSVSNLLNVETYATVHQTTSTIHSKINANISLQTLLYHLFPSGSITGAPKLSTMQIIYNCESEPRYIYTGTIGYITPNNDMCFNVAIRTILLHKQAPLKWDGELGVGGGITIDSNPKSEFEELKLKAKFFV